MDLEVIRTGLTEVLATLQDDANKPQIDKYSQEDVTVPVIRILRPERIGYDIAMQGGGDTVDIIIQALVTSILDIEGQKSLDVLLGRGAGSVKTAIETKDANGTRSLGGRVDDVWVRECTGYRTYSVGGAQVFGAEWTVQVETSH